MGNPWLKFYPQDWRADEKLRNCSLAARGLWVEMLALMHRSKSYGYLLVNGKPATDAQLAVQVGSLPDEVSELIGQLESEGVFSRDRRGWIYSRRMVRDARKARDSRENGKKGGNPNLCSEKENPTWDNPRDNGEVKAQIPEARKEKEEREEKIMPDKSGDYAFFGQTIKLAPRHLNEWRRVFHTIPDIVAELSTLDEWWQTQPQAKRENWFLATKGMLNKKHQANTAIQQEAAAPPVWDGMP